MRYTDGSNNNDITCVVRADGLDCPELRSSNAGVNGQAWIAVKSGQAISVFCDVKLSASQYQLDLVIDGVLRNIVVSTVCPRNEDREEIVEFFEGNHKYARSLFRSPMITSRLQEQSSLVAYNNSDNTRVGTIEVIVYKYDMGYNHTRAAELPENVVDWEDLEGQAGCAGVEPTHEIVLDLNNGKRLNDTERRTWKNKSEKLPMGHFPWTSFKFLYRHESALQDAQLIDPRLNVVPTAHGMSALRAGLLSFATSSSSQSPVAYTRFNGNPWVVRERNGLREYKQLDITPDNPGPQVSHNRRKRTEITKGKKRTRRSSAFKVDDSDSDEFVGSSEATPSKRVKRNVDGLRAEVGDLQLKRDKARRNLEKQTKSAALKASQPDPFLYAQKEALEREIEYINLEAAKYKERHDDLGQQNKVMEIQHDAAEDAIMIDPVLEESSAQAAEASPSGRSNESTSNGSASESSGDEATADNSPVIGIPSTTQDGPVAMPIAASNGATDVKGAASESAESTEDAITIDSNTEAPKASHNIVAATEDMVISEAKCSIVHHRHDTAAAATKS